MNYPYNQQKN